MRAVILLLATAPLAAQAPPPPAKVDRVLIEKSARSMKLMQGETVVKAYKVALSRQPVGAKEREGDHKVPEGQYLVDFRNTHSQLHLVLHVAYPSTSDREHARKLGVRPGGNIEIHGLGKGYAWVGSMHTKMDWTDGCIAVTNAEIDEIWPLIPLGTRVEIRP